MIQGTVVVITGASSGIGEALAIRSAREGAITVLAARRRERLERVADRIRARGGTALVVECDVTLPASAEALIESAVRQYGRIDVLVNNAGRGHFGTVEETTDETLERIFALNVFALWYTTRPALRHMRARGTGHVITISSMAGKLGFPFNSAYVAAKHAAVGFTHALRAELVGSAIHASVVCPGSVSTEFGSVTEGGSMQELFAGAGQTIRRVADEQGLPLVPIEGILPPEAIAEKIVECIEHPVAEVYTHGGSADFAALAARDREEAERYQRAAILGEREIYDRSRTMHR